jgi:hypothetical protein
VLKLSACVLALSGLILTGCGGGEPKTAPASPAASSGAAAPVEQVFVESETCRTDALAVTNALSLALQAEDVRDVASRLAEVEELGATPLAQCSSAVTDPIGTANDQIGCAIDMAMGTKDDCADSMEKALLDAEEALGQVSEALGATS